MTEYIEDVYKRTQNLRDKMPQEKHTEICKEVLFFLWIEDKLFTDEQDLEIELEIERWMKAGVSND